MAFTAGEVANIANAALDFYLNRGDTFKQTIQSKPLLNKFERRPKTFPGGKGDISLAVKGAYGAGGVNDTVAGYTHNDTVNFYTPANIERANYPWREHHLGLTLTQTELKIDGISVVDTDGKETRSHSRREMTMLVNLLNDKLEDLGEQYARSMNDLLWGDGTTDAKALAGIKSIITDIPTTGTVGGIDAATKTWWRNRAHTAAFAGALSFDASYGGGAVTSSPANGGALLQLLQQELRQLKRYGGNPDCFYAGSDFIDAMEVELRANGNYFSDAGEAGKTLDGSLGDLKFKGIPVLYDPTLDDDGRAKFGYLWDSRHIYLMAMQDEWKRQHTPSRPPNQFVLYRSLTCTGQVVAQQRNSALVVEIA